LAVVDELIPTLPRRPLLCSPGGAASPVSRWWHAEKAIRGNSGGQTASGAVIPPLCEVAPVASPISAGERACDALSGVGGAHTTRDFRDSITLNEGRGPTWMRGCSGRTDESIPREGYEVSFSS